MTDNGFLRFWGGELDSYREIKHGASGRPWPGGPTPVAVQSPSAAMLLLVVALWLEAASGLGIHGDHHDAMQYLTRYLLLAT